MLRSEHCQLVISPRPPDGSRHPAKAPVRRPYRVFYDPAVRDAPLTEADYLAAQHVTVVYEPRRSAGPGPAPGRAGHPAPLCRHGAGLQPACRPSSAAATAAGHRARRACNRTCCADLASVEPPVPCPPMPMYAIWHLRYQQDSAHRWLRSLLEAVVGPALAAQAG
jgi:DNA-binding transcriptional LysR family regulator